MSNALEIRNLLPWYVGVAPGRLRKRNLVALQYYIDDSGKNDPPVFVLGGFVAPVENWLAFSREWQSALDDTPTISHFKMADANRNNGVFRGCSRSERDEKVSRLARIIRDHVEFGITIAIPHDAYDRVFKGKMMKEWDTPYHLAHSLIMGRLHKALTAVGNTEEVDVIFDRQLDHEQQILAAYNAMGGYQEMEARMRFPNGPQFADDKISLPLQAADMLVWHIRRSWREGKDRLRLLSAAGPILADEVFAINELWLEDDLLEAYELNQSVARNMNTLFPYQAEAISENFDRLASAANLEQLEMAQPFIPVELVSFPANGMGKYLFVRSCADCHNPHLHKRLGNRCLAEQTAVVWEPGSRA